MNQDNRLLDENRTFARQRARELTPREAEVVSGGIHVFTICTGAPPPFGDGDCGALREG